MEEKTIDLNGKRLILKNPPATVGYEIVMDYRNAASDPELIKKCFNKQLRYCRLILEDGREAALSNDEFINQHLSVNDLIDLQDKLVMFNFGFLVPGAPSNS